jgi:hypothetical protein
MCEDSVEKLNMDTVRRPLDLLIPKLIALFSCSEETVRLRALESINATLFLLCPTSTSLLMGSERGCERGGADSTSSTSSARGSQALVVNMQAFLQVSNWILNK